MNSKKETNEQQNCQKLIHAQQRNNLMNNNTATNEQQHKLMNSNKTN